MAPHKRNILKVTVSCVYALLAVFVMSTLTGSMAEAGQRVRLGAGVYSKVRSSLNSSHRKALTDFYKQRVAALKQNTVTINCENGGGEQNYFDVDLLNSSLEAGIRSSVGSYEVEQPLGIKVVSSQAGWRILLRSSPLVYRGKFGGGGSHKLNPDEVCLMTGNSQYATLDHPVCLVSNGPATKNNFYFDLRLVTKSFHRPGTYKGKLMLSVIKPQKENKGNDHAPSCLAAMFVPFEVEVTSQTLNEIVGNKIYFHVGNPISDKGKLNGTIHGHLETDAPVSLNLKVEDGRIDQLPMIQPFFVNTTYKNNHELPWIPLSWKLSERGGCFRSPDATANHRAISWIIRGTPGAVDYKIDCSINPTTHQDSGEYGTSVTMTIKPLL